MRTVDFSPLFRSAIGFDRLFDLAEAAQRVGEESYPPYNIERLDENRFQISVALAGFKPDEVDLTVEQNVLTLEGRKSEKEGKTFLHRGISARSFKRQFTLADHVEVRGARFEDGLYDPCDFNDRMLLGMKGQLSEAELHFLRSRMRGGG